MDVPIWWLYIPGAVIVAAATLIFRWLFILQRRATEHGERIARLEGRRDD